MACCGMARRWSNETGERSRKVILDIFFDFIQANERAPTLEELALEAEMSTTNVYYHMKVLAERGIVIWKRHGRPPFLPRNGSLHEPR